MNRRSFLRALGLTAAAYSLSPLLDLAPIEAAPSLCVSAITWGDLTRSEFTFWRAVPIGATGRLDMKMLDAARDMFSHAHARIVR